MSVSEIIPTQRISQLEMAAQVANQLPRAIVVAAFRAANLVVAHELLRPTGPDVVALEQAYSVGDRLGNELQVRADQLH